MLKRLTIFIIVMLTTNGLHAVEDNPATAVEPADTIIVNHKPSELISRNLFVEFGGQSLGVGIGYDQRFRPKSVFGFRTGVSFTDGSWDNSGWFGSWDGETTYTSVDFKGVTIPLEVNAILGNRASKFELGIGATPCILHRHETEHWGCRPSESGTNMTVGTKLNIFGTLNIGYRLQRKSGFFLRTGFTFVFGDSDLKYSPVDFMPFFPHLSLGYTIR